MPQAVLLRSAEADLADIWRYIARDSPQNASRLVRRIRTMCSTTLADNPYIGRARPELAPGLRSFPVGNYIVFYRPIEDGVEVVRVVHGSRDIEALFEQ